MKLAEQQSLLGMHCALCNTMAEHLTSPHLAVAQHALLCIAQHQLSEAQNARLAAHVMRQLDMYGTTTESVTA